MDRAACLRVALREQVMSPARKWAILAGAVIICAAVAACLVAYARCRSADGHFRWLDWTCELKLPPGIEIYRDLRRT